MRIWRLRLDRRTAIHYGLFGALVLVGIGGILYAAKTSAVSPRVDLRPGAARAGENVPVSDFSLQDLEGETITLSELRGQPVLLFFWATW